MLSAAPGFFVDHEDAEGLGNDVHLRGFDLEHGSGIEMRVGSVPINIPTHIQGQGYADANFIMPEVVRSIRVLEGPYDPRQGDAAIVGSATFDLGVTARGYEVRSTYGSFGQWRLSGVAAPNGADEETFAAFALRKTNGFGENRASESGTINAQYGFDVGARDHVRLLATAYGARASFAGVVREDDVQAGRIGYYDSYPAAEGQGVQSSRVILAADVDRVAANGARFEFAPWFMWTDFRARQNFTGNLESSQLDPQLAQIGDLFETTNTEAAAGLTARMHTAPTRFLGFASIAFEPGVTVRAGHTDQSKSLLDPSTLLPWDRRIDAGLNTLDAGAYVDVDMKLFDRLRISGGARADLLAISIDDRLANLAAAAGRLPPALASARRDAQGIAAGPRVTAEYAVTPEFAPSISYGEGFRSLDAEHLQEGADPYSKVRSVEAGLRTQALKDRYTVTVALFQTWVANELVFEAEAGGLETQNASIRRGMVWSLVAKPVEWLLASAAVSATSATFQTLAPGVSHYVPSVPPVLLRADVLARGPIARFGAAPVVGRVGVGYTFVAGRHLTDVIVGPSNNVLNATAAVRYAGVELAVDGYNLLGLRYADDEQFFVSSWNAGPGGRVSAATHIAAAPPLALLGTVALYF
jgi:hypothetical protein